MRDTEFSESVRNLAPATNVSLVIPAQAGIHVLVSRLRGYDQPQISFMPLQYTLNRGVEKPGGGFQFTLSWKKGP